MQNSPAVGSLVVPAPAYRASMETGEGAALLLAQRRGSAHLYYPGPDRGYWVPLRRIRPIPRHAVPRESRECLLHDLLNYVRAEECTIEALAGDTMDLAIEGPGLTRVQLRVLERWLGPRLADFRCEPGSMRVHLLRLALVSLPGSADRVT